MAGHAPYLMPDGSRLSQYLADNQLERPHTRKKGKNNKSTKWLNESNDIPSSTNVDDLESFYKAGRDRRRRYLNDKLLRDMAGALTAHDMEALFKPVPFGETNHVKPLTKAMEPEHAQVWEMFRSIDADKQQRILQKWEVHVREAKATEEARKGRSSRLQQAADALQAWARIPRPCRDALKRADPFRVDEVEMRIMDFLETRMEEAEEVEMEPTDGFSRMLAHGLCEYHGLTTITRTSCSPAPAADAADAPGKDLVEAACVVVRKRRKEAAAVPPQEIMCADILLAMEANAWGVTPSVLAAHMAAQRATTDSASDAGSFVVV